MHHASELMSRLPRSVEQAAGQISAKVESLAHDVEKLETAALGSMPANGSVFIGLSGPDEARERSKVAFVWYLTNYESSDIVCAILVAARGTRETHPRANVDFAVIHTQDETAIPHLEKLKRDGIRLIKVSPPTTQGSDQWVESFAKLRIAEPLGYDRVVYFDVDTYPLGRLDYLFDIADFPVEVAAPRAYWLPQPFLQSGGPMVMDPSKNFFKKHFQGILDGGGDGGSYKGEMDWFNKEFRDTAVVLHGFHALLVGEWCNSDGISKYWQKYFDKPSSWVFLHASLVHFIADWKPWKITTPEQLSAKCPAAQPELLQTFQKWWDAKKEVCDK